MSKLKCYVCCPLQATIKYVQITGPNRYLCCLLLATTDYLQTTKCNRFLCCNLYCYLYCCSKARSGYQSFGSISSFSWFLVILRVYEKQCCTHFGKLNVLHLLNPVINT